MGSMKYSKRINSIGHRFRPANRGARQSYAIHRTAGNLDGVSILLTEGTDSTGRTAGQLADLSNCRHHHAEGVGNQVKTEPFLWCAVWRSLVILGGIDVE